MTDAYSENSFLIKNFKDFYTEILGLKAWALDANPDLKNKPIPSDDHRQISKTQMIRDRLIDLLQLQYQTVESQGSGYAANYYREAQYAMVGLADEIFLNIPWEGTKEWEDHLLESALFNSQDAGEKIFQNIDTYLEAQKGANLDLGAIYLLILGLGFQGKYRGEKTPGVLRTYCSNLYQAISYSEARLSDGRLYFFPQAYENIVSEHSTVDIPNPRNWYIILGGCIAFFFLFSYILWHIRISPIIPFINELQRYGGRQ